jgi:hypothetical protein
MNYLSEFYNNGKDIDTGIPQMTEEINEVLED